MNWRSSEKNYISVALAEIPSYIGGKQFLGCLMEMKLIPV